jgi:hypothetical protein
MMQALMAGLMAAHALAVAADPVVVAAPAPVVAPLDAKVDEQPEGVTDAVIKKAVRETIAEDPHPVVAANVNAVAYGANTTQSKMSAAFNQAKVPDCLHDDALKLNPAHIGPIAVVGPYSLPWIISAALTGKCR